MSKFGESLAFIKSMPRESIYHTNNEEGFNKKYLEAASSMRHTIDQQKIAGWQKNAHHKSQFQRYVFGNYYENLYASFLFIYEIELVLDEIEYDGISFNRANALINMCSLLSVTSTNMMIQIDDEEHSFSKKYSLCNDLVNMAKNIYNATRLIYSISSGDMPLSDTFMVTSYDGIETRLSCKYIRNEISVIKLFCILAMMQSTPMCSAGVTFVAKTIMEQLREVLYNKRIMRMIVDSDLYGNSREPHTSTRLKIFFAMGNADRYCIRLDLPHVGENNIHLNINEPAHKRATGFPFTKTEYSEVYEICKDSTLFDRLFYRQDDMYWFRSNYSATIKSLDNCEAQKQALEEFRHRRGHISILNNNEKHLDMVTEFSKTFAEMMIDYLGTSIYGNTSYFDDDIYKYILFQDYIFDVIIRIKGRELLNHMQVGECPPLVISKCEKRREETKFKLQFCKYINERFPDDKELISCTEMDGGLCDFFSKCLDRIDQLGL